MDRFKEPGEELVDLRACDTEPIHIPGSIQPHGLLLVLDRLSLVIQQVSANSFDFTGEEASELCGRPIRSLVDEESEENLRKWAHADDAGARSVSQLMLEATIGRRRFNCVAHRSGPAAVIFELEPAAADQSVLFNHIHSRIEAAIGHFNGQESLPQLLQSAAEWSRVLTGFDRVMVYQFSEDYSGAVVAEDTTAELASLMNHHFPASDIPPQARELYLRNRVRSIPNVEYTPVPITPPTVAAGGEPLDLSDASLRSVSPVHLQYLRNMGVAASMSVSIVRGGRLWGLIACHHRAPLYTNVQVRFAFDFLAQTVALMIGAKEESAYLKNAARLHQTYLQLLGHIDKEANVLNGVASSREAVTSLARASGAALCVSGQYLLMGAAPKQDQVSRLVDWLSNRGNVDAVVSHCLPTDYPESIEYVDRAAGVLAIPLTCGDRSYLIWFRPEIVREVWWAGNPDKPAEPADPLPDGSRSSLLHPRKSFETWKQSVAGTSAPWMAWETNAARTLAEELSRRLLIERAATESAGRRLAEAERDRLQGAAAAMEQVLSVMGHELRTPLAAAGVMAELVQNPQARQMPEFDSYLTSIKTEITRMSKVVNNLIEAARLASGSSQWEWSTVSLVTVCEEALDAIRTSIDGAAVELRFTMMSQDLSMSGDPDALRRMLINLLENAREHTSHGVIGLECSILTDPAGRWVEFLVSDTGEGIAPELANRLGRAFSMNAGVVGINLIRGSGLGLAICAGIAGTHGGRICIESVQGTGTRVSVRILADLPGPIVSPTIHSISSNITG